jgi:hypothetical protein
MSHPLGVSGACTNLPSAVFRYSPALCCAPLHTHKLRTCSTDPNQGYTVCGWTLACLREHTADAICQNKHVARGQQVDRRVEHLRSEAGASLLSLM